MKNQIAQLLLMSIAALASLPFTEACENWLESRKYHISPRTSTDYSHYIKTLTPFFASLKLTDIDGDMLRSYQHERMKCAGPGTINKELGIIIQVRKRINQPVEDYQPLQMPKDYESPGRALTPTEEAALERTCKTFAKHETWDVAALCLLLAMRTGMTRCEILSLKLKDITIGEPSVLEIPRRGAKRVSRERPIALIGDAEWAVLTLIERCKSKCGGFLPDHFLVPAMNRDHSYDPERPAQSYRSGVEHLLAVADIKCRPNDMRHHAMSKALRNPKVTPAMAREQFGHVNYKMQRRYYHGSLENLIAVARAIDGNSQPKKPSSFAQDYRENPTRSKTMNSRGI